MDVFEKLLAGVSLGFSREQEHYDSLVHAGKHHVQWQPQDPRPNITSIAGMQRYLDRKFHMDPCLEPSAVVRINTSEEGPSEMVYQEVADSKVRFTAYHVSNRKIDEHKERRTGYV